MADWWRSGSNMLGLGAATLATGAALYVATRPKSFDVKLDLMNQSQPVPVSLLVLSCLHNVAIAATH